MKRIIVTGGAGFIGCNFVRHVLNPADVEGTAAADCEVLVFDKLTYAGSLESLRDIEDNPRYHFLKADITDRQAVRQAFQDFRPTAVVNFAAESHVDRSIDGPGEFIHTNIVGTFELLEASRHYVSEQKVSEQKVSEQNVTTDPNGDEPFRFLHVSTDEVYGSLGETGLFAETTPYAPNSPYAASKASADHLARAYFHTYGLPVVITNCSNNYGPFQFPEKLIPLMILNALAGKPLPIYGDGANVRDWLYVDDHCRGILLALLRGDLGEKYNIGGHNERTNLQVVDRICDILQEALPPADNNALVQRSMGHYRDLKTFVRDRPGHDQRYAIDSDKIQQQLGWRALHNFETGLEQTVRWYIDNHDWCQAVRQNQYDGQRLGLGKA